MNHLSCKAILEQYRFFHGWDSAPSIDRSLESFEKCPSIRQMIDGCLKSELSIQLMEGRKYYEIDLLIASIFYFYQSKKLDSYKNSEIGGLIDRSVQHFLFELEKNNQNVFEADVALLKEIVLNFDHLWKIPEKKFKKFTNGLELELNPLFKFRPKHSHTSNSSGQKEIYRLPQKNDFTFNHDSTFFQFPVMFGNAADNLIMRMGYNKFSYFSSHGLIIFDTPHHPYPQFLTEFSLRYVRKYLKLFTNEPRMMWNAYGTFGSINHFHLHLIEDVLPIETRSVKNQLLDWPLTTIVFDSSNEEKRDTDLFKFIYSNIHDQKGKFVKDPLFYNIYFTKARTYLILQRHKTEVPLHLGISLGVVQSCGRFIVSEKTDFERITQEQLWNNLIAAKVNFG